MSGFFGGDKAKTEDWNPSAPGDKKCPLCERSFSRLAFKLHLALDKQHIEMIKKDHPEWTEDGGACFECINIYRNEFKLPPLTAEEAKPILHFTK